MTFDPWAKWELAGLMRLKAVCVPISFCHEKANAGKLSTKFEVKCLTIIKKCIERGNKTIRSIYVPHCRSCPHPAA